jgi:hypothetical protein
MVYTPEVIAAKTGGMVEVDNGDSPGPAGDCCEFKEAYLQLRQRSNRAR